MRPTSEWHAKTCLPGLPFAKFEGFRNCRKGQAAVWNLLQSNAFSRAIVQSDRAYRTLEPMPPRIPRSIAAQRH